MEVASDLRWAGVEEGLAPLVLSRGAQCLAAYREDPSRIEEDARKEIATAEGGYGRKQIHELVQNAADAMLGTPGRIEVRLTDETLYVANQGRPVTEDGLVSLLYTHMSRKDADEIGRFGLGFKSITAVSDAPAVFSRSGSFGFDKERSEHEIRRIDPTAVVVPRLRMAWPLSPTAAAEEDPVLADMMRWATTVVRVPVARGHRDLREDLESFPAEFLLLSRHVERLRLVGPDGEVRDVVALDGPRGVGLLQDGRSQSRWRVFSRGHRPSPAALADAGTVRGRESITVSWAVPLDGSGTLGRFWAHFPIRDRTSLSGIVNAPWKLTEDRVSILEGAYNEEILTTVLPGLVADAVPALHEDLDGIEYLDVLPARGREPQSWADGRLNEPVYLRLQQSASLLGTDDRLHEPATMRLHPEGLQPEWTARWMVRPAPGVWVHHDIDTTPTRRAKAIRLLSVDGSMSTDVRGWLTALVADKDPASSAHALALVGDILLTGDPAHTAAAKDADVVLREDGVMVRPAPGQVFLRTHASEVGEFVHEQVVADESAAATLRHLGVGPLDPSGRLRRELVKGQVGREPEDYWRGVWELVRGLDPAVAADVLKESVPGAVETSLLVLTAAGTWRPLGEVLRPGAVFATSTGPDDQWVLDERFHQQDIPCLELLALTDRPRSRAGAPREPWFDAYEEHVRTAFIAALGTRIHPDRIEVSGTTPPLCPMQMLPSLSDEGRAALTTVALRTASPVEWTVAHRTNAGYGKKRVPAPDYWWLTRHGMLRTALGPWPITKCLHPAVAGQGIDLARFLPVPLDELHGRIELLGMRTSLDDLEPEDWVDILAAGEARLGAGDLALLYAWASEAVDAPPTLLAHVGQHRQRCVPADVAVTDSESTFHALQRARIPALLVPGREYVEVLAGEWGMEDASDVVGVTYVPEPRGEAELLVDLFPSLRNWLDPENAGEIEVQECTSIEQVITTPAGRDSTWRESATTEDGRVLYTAEDRLGALRQIGEELDLGLEPEDLRAVLDQEQRRRSSTLVQSLREAPDDIERLVLAVGEEALRSKIPAAAMAAVAELGEEPSARELATLAMAIHGHGILADLKGVLAQRQLDPPGRWHGGVRARRFVADLGFGPEWAGYPDDGERGATLAVPGPARIRPLHDYQHHVAQNIRHMIRGAGPARGLVALPTGAGKTRVAVQALTEALAAGELRGPVVWIAQTDELCEQAVQSWAAIWRGHGEAERDLVLSRFWGSNTVAERPEAVQVVVSTPQTLKNAASGGAYEWLTTADMVVVDEAHRSVAPMYTAVLEWLGRGRSRRERRLLLGLTATPFRGTSEPETIRLARRYDDNRLETGAFAGNMHTELQERGVLARVSQRVLGGANMSLSYAELEELRERHLLPKGVEQRLGRDLGRNKRIVEDIVGLPDDWTVLLFATSVDNAEALAAHLAYLGVPAAAVSGGTSAAQRRHVVERFKAGELRVLTNYGVLAEGFDVPGVRAVYVARPTWSPNLYQQMIGRGLRGPLNGGSEVVDIVNVEDNVAEFGERLAFNHFEHIWSGGNDGQRQHGRG